MRRSATTFQAVEAKQPFVSRRSATLLVVPSIHVVEKCLDQLALNSVKLESGEEMTSTTDDSELVDAVIEERENQENVEAGSKDEYDQEQEECVQQHDELNRELGANEKLKREEEDDVNQDAEQEDDEKKEEEEEGAGITMPNTLISDTVSSCRIHKSLKDLIFKTNKEIYAVDSNKVKYKVGLSKRGSSLPSLHPKKRSAGNDCKPLNMF